MSFLLEKCTLKSLDEKTLSTCQKFSCDHKDLNDFFLKDCCDYSSQLLGKTYCFTLDSDPSVIVCAFTISNDSVKAHTLPRKEKKALTKNIPHQKHFRSFPAVLIGRLGVNKDFKNQHIGSELMTFIKSWFRDPTNKTGCRFVVVDSYNETIPLSYYKKNDFWFLLPTEELEREYLKIPLKCDENGNVIPLKTRLMVFDLIHLNPGVNP